MNTVYIKTLLACIASIPLQTMAQKAVADSLLNPHINVEREYTPIIQDATKINSIPTRHKGDLTQFPIIFENTVPLLRNLSYQSPNLKPGAIDTQIDYNTHRGYLTLGGGTRLNLEGAAGYRIIESSKDQLDLFANYNSTNGNVEYLNPNPIFTKTKAKNMTNFIKAKYSHQFSTFSWYLNASFLNDNFNYYGNPYWNPNIANPIIQNIDKKQNVNIINAETGIKASDYTDIDYAINVKYDHISYKYGSNINFDGPQANILDGSLLLGKKIDANQKIGIKASGMFQSIGDVKFSVSPFSNFHSLSLFKATPFYQLENGDFSLSVGAKINYALDINDKFLVSPALNASWLFNERSSVYINVDGGINDNNLVKIFRENKYINTNSRVELSQTLYDAKIGINTGNIEGLQIDIHGGYKYTKDEHLFVPQNNESWANLSTPIYANLGIGNVGGSISTYLVPYTNLSVVANTYFYNVSKYSSINSYNPEYKEPWGLPRLRLNANLDFTFVPGLLLSLHYTLESGRKSYIQENIINMKNINELNLRAMYSFSKSFSLYAKVSNILNKKYEQNYGYTMQGTNIIGGISLTF